MMDRSNARQPALWDEDDLDEGARATPSRAARPPERTLRAHANAGRDTSPDPAPVVLSAKRPSQPMDYAHLWDIDEVANYLGVPKQTIYGWRQKGYGPQGFRVGKHLRWRAAAVVTWTIGLEREG